MSTRRTISLRFRYGQLIAIEDALRLTKYHEHRVGRTALVIVRRGIEELEPRIGRRKGAKL